MFNQDKDISFRSKYSKFIPLNIYQNIYSYIDTLNKLKSNNKLRIKFSICF